MRRFVATSVALLAFTAPALAQLSPIGPFTGLASEGFESQPNGGVPGSPVSISGPASILGGAGTMSGVHSVNLTPLYIWNSTGGLSLGLNGVAVPFDGLKGVTLQSVLNNDPVGRFDFVPPVQDFGAYWASAATSARGNPPVSLTFYDSGGGVIGTDSFTYPTALAGVMVWHGWTSTTPIAAVEFTGFWATVDGLQINVPAPGAVSFCLGGLAWTLRRRRAQGR